MPGQAGGLHPKRAWVRERETGVQAHDGSTPLEVARIGGQVMT